VTALPYTPTRLRLARAIAAGQVEHYPFITPETSDRTTGRLVTANVRLLVGAGLAEIPAVDPAGPHNYSVVRLTPAGELWLEAATSGAGPGSTSPEPGPPGCPRDTNGDGDCGRPACPHCGALPEPAGPATKDGA
jgi:hypothetical protein